MAWIRKSIAEKITGGPCSQVVSVQDLKTAKRNLAVRVNERESIILQYYLFFHGWRTVERKSYENKPWKTKSMRKSKFKFEPLVCSPVIIHPDGTFNGSLGGWDGDGINIKFEEIMGIFEEGYCDVK